MPLPGKKKVKSTKYLPICKCWLTTASSVSYKGTKSSLNGNLQRYYGTWVLNTMPLYQLSLCLVLRKKNHTFFFLWSFTAIRQLIHKWSIFNIAPYPGHIQSYLALDDSFTVTPCNYHGKDWECMVLKLHKHKVLFHPCILHLLPPFMDNSTICRQQ